MGVKTRFLSGQSCIVGVMIRFLFGLSCRADAHIFIWPVLSCGTDNQIFVRQSCLVALITKFFNGQSVCGADDQILVWSVLGGGGLMTRFLSCQSCSVVLINRLLSGVSCGADDLISANILNIGVILPWGVLSGERRGSVRCRKSLSLSQALIYIFPDSAVFRPYFSALKIMNNIHSLSVHELSYLNFYYVTPCSLVHSTLLLLPHSIGLTLHNS